MFHADVVLAAQENTVQLVTLPTDEDFEMPEFPLEEEAYWGN